jgi:hypothetical protein
MPSPLARLRDSAAVQAKLAIGEPNDKYEQEADRVARDVVQRINSPVSDAVQQDKISHQKTEEEWQRKSMLRMKEAIDGGEAPSELESSINRVRGSGRPLDASLQESMGQAMGADFCGVRVHTDAQSDRLNQSIQAKAFTTGQDVFFRQGEYQPGSRGGQELIAHELTHVVQQSAQAKDEVTVEGKATVVQKSIGAKWIQRNPDRIEQEVATFLSFGAGNRKSDIVRTKGESVVRVNAIQNLGRGNRGMIKKIAQNYFPEAPEAMQQALGATIVKAGNCMEHAAVAFFFAIAKYPGKQVSIMSAKGLDHAFVLVLDKDQDLEDGLVIDAWQKSDNGKLLKNSNWTGSTNITATYKADGENYLYLALSELDENLDSDAVESALKRSAQQTESGKNNPYTVYSGL